MRSNHPWNAVLSISAIIVGALLLAGGCSDAATEAAPDVALEATTVAVAVPCDTNGDCGSGQTCQDYDCDGNYHCTSSPGGHYNCCDDSSDCGVDSNFTPPVQLYCGYVGGRAPKRCLWMREGSPRPYTPLPSREDEAPAP